MHWSGAIHLSDCLSVCVSVCMSACPIFFPNINAACVGRIYSNCHQGTEPMQPACMLISLVIVVYCCCHETASVKGASVHDRCRGVVISW